MKRKRCIGLLCILLISYFGFRSNPANAEMVTDQSVKLKINNSYVVYSNQQLPYIDSNGRTLLPLRLIGDLLGADVSWNVSEKRAVVSFENDKISVVQGENHAVINGEVKLLDTEVVLKNSTIMLPMRFIADAFEIKIEYQKDIKLVQLADPRIMSSETLTHIDEMQRLATFYKGIIHPSSVQYVKDDTNDENNKLVIKVINVSSQALEKGQLNRNIIFYATNTKVRFVGTRGMISPDGSTGINTDEIKASGVYKDEIMWESIENIQGSPIRYILCNYFVTAS
ncbi:copper amine oxidase N-terminal domain-containing protein [Paenibacillus sp. BC26]|uniref:copper amine oxidase N-terminal domain-containing protein n=1 Tax=Paenibacillus sp. BC26 TaxID=1881032 RepID=UPI0008F2E15F|nr:copper amine oxidase N-terminal domain-containing protein [Paenibacillus sp. BC26]SFS76453.1 Copper amine oxidase N-terminal domain-containing protein [Paenibacillus sp. BC26]